MDSAQLHYFEELHAGSIAHAGAGPSNDSDSIFESYLELGALLSIQLRPADPPTDRRHGLVTTLL
jgi:hypothetical protein